MVTKKFLNQLALKKAAVFSECEIPGEPMIFSHKLQHKARMLTINHVRGKDYGRILRCFYPRFSTEEIPVVVLVRFYVTPRKNAPAGWDEVRTDKVTATHSYELCDYLLAFLEIIKNALLKTYTQIVKIDAVKFYSKRPRTCFKIMTWSDYGQFQNNYTVDAKAKGFGTRGKIRFLQPKPKGDGQDHAAGEEPVKRRGGRASARPSASDLPLPSTSPRDMQGTEAPTETHDPAQQAP